MARIQIGIELDQNKDGKPEMRVTPVDVEVPADVARAARIVSDFFDSNDAQPNDGEADIAVRTKIPVKFLFVNTNVEFNGGIFLKVVD